MRLINSQILIKIIYNSFFNYPTPSNLTYFWNYGIYAIICLIIQIITGIFSAMHYSVDINLAFISIEHIMRDINYGWLLRYIHANGASMFFIVVYIHIFRNLYYNSFIFPRQFLWNIGVIILLLMIITAFLGYVLPWGQMSFWGATVITNLFSAIPYFGNDIVIWLWGGYSVDNATLNRFFSLHFTLPFILIGLVLIHIILLHLVKSNNPLGIKSLDNIKFYPYYIFKDLFGLILFFIFFSFFIFFIPNYLGHSDNYILANPMITPSHIVPEWYFLLFYAILRSVPDKLIGILLLVIAILSLILISFIHLIKIRSNLFKPYSKYFFWFFLINCLILSWLGGEIISTPFIQIGQFSTFFYSFYLIILSPLILKIEIFLFQNLIIKK
jgi:quinol-cytochrome oxidoreductase complex cytochrome b subunit